VAQNEASQSSGKYRVGAADETFITSHFGKKIPVVPAIFID
jgi:hypothetical protein